MGEDCGAGRAAGGLAFRYRASQQFPLDFSVDGSINQEDDVQLYIYVGQRF